MKKIIYPCLLFIAACTQPQSPQKGLVYFNDCEFVKGWAPINLDSKIVHSGIYSNKLDTAHVFGLTLKLLFKEISTEKVARVKVSMWTYMTPESKGAMVMEIRNKDGKQLLWDSKKLDARVMKTNLWQQVSTDFTIRKDTSLTNPNNIISVYAWDEGKTEFYVDDIRVEFVLGNRQ